MRGKVCILALPLQPFQCRKRVRLQVPPSNFVVLFGGEWVTSIVRKTAHKGQLTLGYCHSREPIKLQPGKLPGPSWVPGGPVIRSRWSRPPALVSGPAPPPEGLFAAQTLSQWPACRRYYLVDLWRPQENYEERANVPLAQQERHLRNARRRPRLWVGHRPPVPEHTLKRVHM